jgi:hypothetical protein
VITNRLIFLDGQEALQCLNTRKRWINLCHPSAKAKDYRGGYLICPVFMQSGENHRNTYTTAWVAYRRVVGLPNLGVMYQISRLPAVTKATSNRIYSTSYYRLCLPSPLPIEIAKIDTSPGCPGFALSSTGKRLVPHLTVTSDVTFHGSLVR